MLPVSIDDPDGEAPGASPGPRRQRSERWRDAEAETFERLGCQLYGARQSYGYSQAEHASIAETTQSALSYAERGERVGLKSLIRLAGAVGLEVQLVER